MDELRGTLSDMNPSSQCCRLETKAASLRKKENVRTTNFSKAYALHSVSQNTREMVTCTSMSKQQSCNQEPRQVSLPEKAEGIVLVTTCTIFLCALYPKASKTGGMKCPMEAFSSMQ